MGMAYAMVGMSVLPGGPGSGGVLQHKFGSLDWVAAWTYAGVLLISGFLVFFGLRWSLVGSKLRVKV